MKFEDWIERLTDWSWRREQQQFYWDSFWIGIIVVGGFYIGGPVFIGWFIWKQVKLEKSFYDRYGQNWQEEYQKYYGSLAHAHLKIGIAVAAFLSIAVIGLWFYRQMRRTRKKRSRG